MAETGWKPIPLSLKVLFVVFVLWIVGSVFALPGRYELGLPFFGVFVYGVIASLIVLVLDILAPSTFLFALWKRKAWGPTFAFSYIGIFIINSIVAIFTVREQLGFMPIFMPLLFNVAFLAVIYKEKDYLLYDKCIKKKQKKE
jgi:hypothetical protein